MPLDADVGASLIDLAGTPAFAPRLLDAAATLAGMDEVFAYAIDAEGARPLASASALDHQDQRVKEYARRFYRQDPANYDSRSVEMHSGFSQTVGIHEIAQRDYRKICFEEPRFAGKLCYGWRGADHTIVLNFYSRRESAAAGQDLASLADLALASLNRRLKAKNADHLVDVTESRLLAEFPQLTQRERQIIARSIHGGTAEAVARELGITKGTVLTYRQRAYQKYGFGSAAAFLQRLV